MSKYKYKDIASEYDNMVKQYNWEAPEMIYKYLSVVVQKHTKMLDIGAGTGISSERFRDKQVEIYGLDNSDELIEVCKSKGIFKEVLLIDILKDRLPYPDLTFDYVVCSGVFHFFSYLEDIFEKVCNVLKKVAISPLQLLITKKIMILSFLSLPMELKYSITVMII
nr:class I SAM-dependent methyltransferase [uncultured Draconibacterium sp.]